MRLVGTAALASASPRLTGGSLHAWPAPGGHKGAAGEGLVVSAPSPHTRPRQLPRVLRPAAWALHSSGAARRRRQP